VGLQADWIRVDIDRLHEAIKELKEELARVQTAIRRLETLADAFDPPSGDPAEDQRESDEVAKKNPRRGGRSRS
jgi:hypothetical protein